ncbi:MAG: gliding motility-associated C-terminal domain-containing protein [Flavobacteriales bacterium]|nr:gliding motility-associated C-terminal domain-containing protein [Flavobacteriales bacterium]
MRLIRLFSLLVLLLGFNALRANHVLGGNITWECLGAGQYEVTFTLYKDCYGTPSDPATESMYFYPSGCASVPFSFDLSFVSSTEISDLCATELVNSSCNSGGFQPGTSQVVYTGVVTLDPGCVWQAIWNNGDWNYFGNMNALPQNAYFSSFIDTSQPCQDSPDIISTAADPQIPYLCLNTPFTMTLPMSNPNGYTLNYTLGTCQTTGASTNTSITASGYTLPAGFTLTGNQINWTPTQLGNYAVCIEIEIYDGPTYIGTMTENMAFVVRNCSPSNTTFDIPQVTSVSGGTVQSGNNNVSVCVGDSLIFTVEANNPVLTRGITLSYTPIPGLPLSFTQTGLNPAVGTFSLLATPAMIGGSPYVLNIHAVDDACPNPDTDDITVNITIIPNIELVTQDTTICFGQNIALQATGLSNNNYTWNVLTGGDNSPAPANNVATQNMTPDFSTCYRVSATGIPAQCASSDTVCVDVAMTDLDLNSMSETCGNNNGAIDLTVEGDGSGDYDYQWTGINTIDGQEDQFGLSGGVGQNYSVAVTDNIYGCTLVESTNVADVAQPALTFTSDTTICNGGTATLTLDFTAGIAPFDIDFLNSPPADVNNVPDGYTVNVSPTTTTTYTISDVTDNSGCNAVVNQSVTVTVRPLITSVFNPEPDICVGSNLVLDMDHSAAGNYSVEYSINGVLQAPAVVVADGGTLNVPDPATSGTFTYDIESVSYTTLPFCPSGDAANPSITVVVDPLPTAVLSGDATVCAGDCHNFTLTLTGTGPWVVNYTIGGVAQPALNVPAAASPYNYTWQVCPAANSTYCITGVQDSNCSNTVAGECAVLTIAPYPVVNYSVFDVTICEGTCTTASISVNPAGTYHVAWDESPDDTGLAATANNLNGIYSPQLCPTVDTDYCVDSVYYSSTPQCATQVDQCITVEVNGEIAVQVVDTICNNTSTQYQVVFEVSGGTMPYYEDPTGDNTTVDGTGTIFTTAWITSGLGDGPWIFGDVYDCNNISLSMSPYICPVLTDAGTMVINPQTVCGNTALTGVWNNDGYLDGNDQQMFILHTTSNGTLGTVIATDCNDASFGDADSPLSFGLVSGNNTIVSGTTYYISSVVGDDSGAGVGGCVATAAPNVQISPGTPVTWYAEPQVNYSIADTELCSGECATLHATVTPAYQFTIQFSETPADPILGQATGQNSPFDYVVCPNETTEYCLDSVYFTGAPQCATVLNQCITVNLNEDISVVASDTICNNISTQYQVQFTVSGGETPYDEDPAGVNATPDVSGTVFTTGWVNSGSGSGPYVFSDVNNCNSVSMTINPYSCPIITESGTMDNTLITVCGGQVNANSGSGVFNNDAVLDGNDQQMFVLHTGSGSTLGTIIATDCDDAVFGDADSPLSFGAASAAGVIVSGTTYYISSVAGDDSGAGVGGCVNLAAANVQISTGEPIIWYQSSTATVSSPNGLTACEGENVDLLITFTGQGPWTVVPLLDNAVQPSITVPVGGNPYTWSVNATGNYCLQSVINSPEDCPGTVNGCANVLIHPLPTATFSASASTCSGTDHCFDIDLTGTAPWTIEINDPDNVNELISQTSDNPYQYCVGVAGPYLVANVTDANGCTNPTDGPQVTLTVNALPTIQWTFGDSSFCEGSCIDLTMAMSGQSTFDVNIISADPAVTSSDLQNIGAVYTITVCEPGDYELVDVTDSNGCVSTGGDIIHLDEIPTPIADAGPDGGICAETGTTIGTAAIAGQTYSWSPTIGMAAGQSILAQPTVNLNVPSTYIYTVTATVEQCSATDAVQIIVYPHPTVNILADDETLCFDSCATLTASGADTYVWDASASISGSVNSNVIDVCPSADETFTVTGYEDNNGVQCSSTETIDIVIAPELTVAVDYSTQVCFGTCDGFADFTIGGGYPSYQVNGDPSTQWTDLCPGTYDYDVTDVEGCIVSGQFIVQERPEEIIDYVVWNNPICFGDETGQIVIDDADGTNFTLQPPTGPDIIDDIPPYQYDNLGAGDYILSMEVEVEPGIICYADTPVTLLSLSSEVLVSVLNAGGVYCGNDEVCFNTDASGGTGNLALHWSDCAQISGCEISMANPFCFDIIQDTTLYVFAVDENNCSSDTISASASLFPEISFDFDAAIDTVICQNDCTELIAQTSGGNGNILVSWYQIPVDNVPFFVGDTATVCPLFDTDYWIEASDGCSVPVYDTIHVTVHETPVVLFETDTMEGCYPALITFYDLSLPLVDDHTCQWGFGNDEVIDYCGDTTYTYPDYGNFYPSLTITTEYGCVGTDTLDDPLIIHGYPEIDFTWEPQPVTVLEHEVQFINHTTGAIGYDWNFYFTGTSELANPSWNFPDIDQADFDVCLSAVNQFGCADTLCQIIVIESILEVFVPNTFTPDGDGINDVFLPYVSGIKKETYKFWIFNRWGDVVFYTEDYDKAWTGGFQTGEYYVQDGTYGWRMEVEPMTSNEIEVFEGHVNILR